MDFILSMVWIVMPIVFTGAVALFVIQGLKKKVKTSSAALRREGGWRAADSAIPLSMIAGGAIAAVISLFFPVSFLYAIPFGGAGGMLIGYSIFSHLDKKHSMSS